MAQPIYKANWRLIIYNLHLNGFALNTIENKSIDKKLIKQFMERLLFSALATILSVSFAIAQPTIQWQKCLGGSSYDLAKTIQQTIDGGYIVAGNSSSINGDVSGNQGEVDCWVVKLTSLGTIEWQKSLGGSISDLANSIQQTNDGGYIVAGLSFSTNDDFSGNHGSGDCWVVKLDNIGTIVWQKTFGGSNFDEATSIQQTYDGGYIFTGNTQSNDGDVSGNHGTADYWVVKLTSTGTIAWQKTLGGSFGELAYSIKQTIDGGYIVAGLTHSNDGDVSGNHGFNDCWLVKLTSIGLIEWKKTIGGTEYDIPYSIQQTNNGGYIIAGQTGSNNGDVSGNHGSSDYWVIKLTSLGAIEWQKTLGGTTYDEATSIQQTNDGGYIVTGYSNSNDGDVSGNHGDYDFWMVKLTNIGSIEWQKSLGGSDREESYSIKQTNDGGYIASGVSYSNDGDVSGNHGERDFWVVKLTNCQLSISTQPESQTLNINSNAQFVVSSSDPSATYQWQTDLGVGFQNLNNIGQFSGITNDTLTISNATLTNNNQPFRCIVSSGFCRDTSASAVLTVINIADQTVPSYVPTSGLVGWWPFNGNANDESGYNDHGTVNNTTLVPDRFGVLNSAYYFNKNNSYIELNNINYNQYSVSTWLKYFVLEGDSSTFFSKGCLCFSDESFSNYVSNDRHWIRVSNSSITGELNISNSIDTSYHHIVVTYDQISTKFYKDGILMGQSSYIQGPIKASTFKKYIGAWRNYTNDGFLSSYFFNGIIDEVGMWNRALTQQEITNFYNATNCSNNLTISPVLNQLQSGSTANFSATPSDPNPNYIWQSDFGQGFQNLNDFGNYSGTNTATLNIANVQLSEHNQPIRVISTSGECVDTSDVASISITDTCINFMNDTTFIAVTDTLIINTLITDINQQNNSNTIKVFPNPTNSHITIDYGNFVIMNGYQLKIQNSIGQQVFQTNITQQTDYLSLNNWGGNGIYFVHIIDAQGNTIDIRKIVLQ
jgi:hypothetical protein